MATEIAGLIERLEDYARAGEKLFLPVLRFAPLIAATRDPARAAPNRRG